MQERANLAIAVLVNQRNNALDSLVNAETERMILQGRIAELEARIADAQAEIDKLKSPATDQRRQILNTSG